VATAASIRSAAATSSAWRRWRKSGCCRSDLGGNHRKDGAVRRAPAQADLRGDAGTGRSLVNGLAVSVALVGGSKKCRCKCRSVGYICTYISWSTDGW
jgi:hypothetical protein